MTMQTLLIRASFMTVVGIGIAVAAIYHHHLAPVAVVAVVASAPAIAPAAKVEPIMLPTVKVRPAAADLATPIRRDRRSSTTASHVSAASTTEAVYATDGTTSPNLRVDMPYYSFGKSPTRVRKE